MRKFIKRYIPIRMREDLSRTEKVVLCGIIYNAENPRSRRTLKERSRLFGISYRYVIKAVQSLAEKGLCRYMIDGNKKYISITGKVTSTIQGSGTIVHIVNQSSPSEPEFTYQVNQSSPEIGTIVHSPSEPQFTPPLGIPSNRGIEESSRGGAEAPASTQKGCAGPRSEKEDGKGTDTEPMRKNHSSAEADPRGEFRHAKKGYFEALKSNYHQHYPRKLKEEQECWELFSAEVDSWEEYDNCRKCFRTMDARPATLRDYLKEAPWKD